ncbi:hypothetical protein Avbf_18763, partial [Armadillidium vulgare]
MVENYCKKALKKCLCKLSSAFGFCESTSWPIFDYRYFRYFISKQTKMSDAKRKPSGSEFKKRRLNKQTQLQKQSDALQNFLKEGSFNAPTTDQHLKNAQHLDTDFPDMDPPLDAT